jgi:magnesium-transporting ATPase (P-type)
MNKSEDHMASTPWHDRPVEATLAELGVTPDGLSEGEAQARLVRHGPNRLPEPPRRNALTRFLLQFHNILIYVLFGAAVITALLQHLRKV